MCARFSPARPVSFNRVSLDVLGQAFPQQQQAFQQGNVGAQQQLLAGLPQIQNAILGRTVDTSGFAPTTIGLNTGFTQQTLPTFQGSAAALQAGQPAQPAALDPSAFAPGQLEALAAQLHAGGFFQQATAAPPVGQIGLSGGGGRGGRGGGGTSRGDRGGSSGGPSGQRSV